MGIHSYDVQYISFKMNIKSNTRKETYNGKRPPNATKIKNYPTKKIIGGNHPGKFP